MYYLYHNGVFAGTTDDPEAVLPGEGWAVSETSPEPTEAQQVLNVLPEPLRFVGTELYQMAINQALTNPAVQMYFNIALFAESQGLQDTLADAMYQLEEILTET